jgi:hypothetical protein
MLYFRLGVTVLALTLLGAAYLQDPKPGSKKSDDKEVPKLRGQLPAYYKKLGLRDDQVQKIYRIRADYKAKVEDLKRKMDRLKSEEKESLEKVLTPEQLKRLKELRTGEK